SRAFLAARLVDVLVRDWDRLPAQWRWARFDEVPVRVGRPIPGRRHQAFSRLDGLLPPVARHSHPRSLGVGDRYPDLGGLAVDVQATDEADVADVQRQGDGSVTLQLARRDATRYYMRTFHPGETSEVRLYLHDGDDRVVVRGAGRGAITVRVITGAGHSALIDSTRSGRTFFYVDHTPARVISGPRSSVDRGAARGGPQQDPLKLQLRDWGTRWTPAVRLSFAPDVGVLVGFGETGM